MSRSSLYQEYKKLATRNEHDAELLRSIHEANPHYGVRRLAIKLKWSEGKTRRLCHLANITAKRIKKPKNNRGKSEIDAPPNLLKDYWQLKDETQPEKGYTFAKLTDPKLNIWIQDFTYIWFKGRFYYFAATNSIATRQVMGWSFGYYHTADLICDSLFDALEKHIGPSILHNDRGSEYMSEKHYKLCGLANIKMSASDSGSPWQNGFMESFFSTFKNEMRDKFCMANNTAELYEMIAQWIYYYNHERIHTALKMTPDEYARKLSALDSRAFSLVLRGIDKVCGKNGA